MLLVDDPADLDVIREIAPDDPMYGYSPELYFEAGTVAVRCIQIAMAAAGLERVDSVLDFAAGSGRVLRTLKAAFPDAALTAVDTYEPGLDFCANTLGARAIKSHHDPARIELDGQFDLIWCGSLLTHVDAGPWLRFLEIFESVLAPGGVAVFTTYGRTIVEALRDGSVKLDLDEEQVQQVLEDHNRSGFGFAPTMFPSIDPGALSVAQVEQLQTKLRDQGRNMAATIVSVLAFAGLRPREVVALRWADVEATVLAVGDRRVQLLPRLAEDLARWRAESGGSPVVFPGDTEGPFADGEWRAWTDSQLRPAVQTCGIKLEAPYDLRHTFSSLLAAQGASTGEIAEQLGAVSHVGDCVTSRPWLCTQLDQVPSLDLVLYFEHGWLQQDVIGVTKRPERP